MALMSEERRKEMEEEMSRFEQEIALPSAPTEPPSPPASVPAVPNSTARREVQPEAPRKPKRLSPPPVVNILPAVLCPPPPPPATPPPLPPIPPPPPPPSLPSPVLTGVVQFIPHQLQRAQLQPPRLPLRPPFMGMRGPGPFPPQGLMTHFPPMHHGPPPPPPHHMHHQHMPVPTMGVGLPLPPGFCPPPVPPMPPPLQNMNPVSQAYMPPVLPPVYNNNTNNNNNPVTTVESTVSEISEPDSVVASAPAVYAAPPMKSQGDKMFEGMTVTNGESPIVSTIAVPVIQRIDKPAVNKTVDDSGGGISASTPISEEVVVSKKKEKKKKVIRMAGGQAWEDNSLVEWDPDDFRIFCGDLGNDVTDEVLIRAFSKYQSFVKAKVIRDKRTNKTKGYGFVSFKDPQDFIKAMREMNGRYVGSRPIKLRKSTWKDRNIEIVKRKQKEKEKLGLL